MIPEGPDYIRRAMAIIKAADYYVGVCSMGQHFARGLGRPGLVIMGGTDERNFSYADHFKIYRRSDRQPCYMPWRISESDAHMMDRMNSGVMDFTKPQIREIIDIILQQVGTKSSGSMPTANTVTVPDTIAQVQPAGVLSSGCGPSVSCVLASQQCQQCHCQPCSIAHANVNTMDASSDDKIMSALQGTVGGSMVMGSPGSMSYD